MSGPSSQPEFTCDTLRRRVDRQVASRAGRRGAGAPLAFLLIVGTGAFTVVWPDPPVAFAWAVLTLLGLWLTVRHEVRRPVQRRRALASLAARHFTTRHLRDPDASLAADRSAVLFAEIAAKTLDVAWALGADPHLDRVLADAASLVRLLIQSASQDQEFDRILRAAGSPPASSGETSLALIREIEDQLRGLLLAVAQLEHPAGHLVETARVTTRASETLDRLRLVARTRREAGEEIARSLSPQ
jgi:hypothetical protein